VIHLLKNPSSQGQVDYDAITEEMAGLHLSAFHIIGTVKKMIAKAERLQLLT